MARELAIKVYKQMLGDCHEDYRDTKQWYIDFIRRAATADGNWEDDNETMHDVCLDIEACAAILVELTKED